MSRIPVADIPRTRDLYNDFISYRWVANDSAPFPPLTKPISKWKIALMSSGGIMYRDQPRFHRGRVVSPHPAVTPAATNSAGCTSVIRYATPSATLTVSCRSSECARLEAAGVIGELANPACSFMGGIYSARKVRANSLRKFSTS